MRDIVFFDCNDKQFNTVKNIRTQVFTNEQGADAAAEFDSLDNFAEFALLYDNGVPAGTARLVYNNNGCKIGRIAVLKSFRGKGCGAFIVKQICKKAFDKGAENVFVDAQNYAVPFYQKLGFKINGEQLYDRGLPHIPMMLEVEHYDKEK